MTNIRVGTASWSEPEFIKAGWYPAGLLAGQRLSYYAGQFDLVELNSSFYAIPGIRQCARWAEQTPANFVFDVKCHRLLSRHATKSDALPASLRDEVEITERGNVILTPALEADVAGLFLGQLAPLEQSGKLGALLLQLTPSFSPRHNDLGELEGLLRQLRGTGKVPRKVAVEFRHRDWLTGEQQERTLNFLRQEKAALVTVDGPPADDPKHFTILPALGEVTDPALSYLRLHGRNAKAYLTGKTVAERFDYDYSDAELDAVFGWVERLSQQADEVHVVFNNNARDYAPKAAARFLQRLGDRQTPPAVLKQQLPPKKKEWPETLF